MKPIYGYTQHTQPCVPDLGIFQTLFDRIIPSYKSVVDSIATFIDSVIKYSLSGNIVAIRGDIGANVLIPIQIVVRLEWRRMYKNITFNKNNNSHLSQIKDIYATFNADWSVDELFSQ